MFSGARETRPVPAFFGLSLALHNILIRLVVWRISDTILSVGGKLVELPEMSHEREDDFTQVQIYILNKIPHHVTHHEEFKALPTGSTFNSIENILFKEKDMLKFLQ
jgi:hypothetical protein